jgi:hypothetical protein
MFNNNICFDYIRVAQLFKLPSLVQHYFDHQISENKVTILSFLIEHYSDNPMEDSKHHELPFKSHDDCQSHNIVVYPPKDISFTMEPRGWYLKNLDSYLPVLNSSTPLASIWQPPKNLA